MPISFLELSLFVKNQVDKAGPTEPTNEDFSCRYCGQKSYHSTRCPFNPYREIRCTFPWSKCKVFWEIPWSKWKRNVDRLLLIAAARVKSGEELKLKEKEDEEPVAVVLESRNRDFGSAKRETQSARLFRNREVAVQRDWIGHWTRLRLLSRRSSQVVHWGERRRVRRILRRPESYSNMRGSLKSFRSSLLFLHHEIWATAPETCGGGSTAAKKHIAQAFPLHQSLDELCWYGPAYFEVRSRKVILCGDLCTSGHGSRPQYDIVRLLVQSWR